MTSGKFMRACVVPVLLAVVFAGWLCSPAVAGPIIIVDEFGNGTIDFGTGLVNMPGVMQADPGPGGLNSALTYNLQGPPSLVAGDVWLIEPGPGANSDLIRFNPAIPGTPYPASLLFYSDNSDGADGPADTGFPTALYTNVLSIPEVGSEGANGASYTPTANQPGYVDGFTVTYQFISDSDVPEPSTVLLLVSGLGLVCVGWRRRTRRM